MNHPRNILEIVPCYHLTSKNARGHQDPSAAKRLLQFLKRKTKSPKRRCLNTSWCDVYTPDWLFTHHPISTPRDGQRLGVVFTLAHACLTCLPRMPSWHNGTRRHLVMENTVAALHTLLCLQIGGASITVYWDRNQGSDTTVNIEQTSGNVSIIFTVINFLYPS